MINYIFKDGESDFSSKFIKIAAGLGSFTGLFPLFYSNSLTQFIPLYNPKYIFIVYTMLYFISPFFIGLVWFRYTNRYQTIKPFKIRYLSLNIWLIYFLIKVFLFLLTLLFPTYSIYYFILITDILFSILLITSQSSKLKYGVLIIIISYLVQIMFNYSNNHKNLSYSNRSINSKTKGDTAYKSLQYQQLTHSNNLYDTLISTNAKLLNIAERYLIKSRLSVELFDNFNFIKDTKDSNYKFNLDSEYLEEYSIKPYLNVFTTLILDNDSLKELKNKNLLRGHLTRYIQKNLNSSLNNNLFFNLDRFITRLLHYEKQDSLNKSSSNYFNTSIALISNTIDSMLGSNNQLIRPDSLKRIQNQIKLTAVFPSKNKKHATELKSKKFDSIIQPADQQLVLTYYSNKLNLINAIALYNWLVEQYIPYVERKANAECSKIFKNTLPIWEYYQENGIMICLNILAMLIIFWLWCLEGFNFSTNNNSEDKNEHFRNTTFPLVTIFTIYFGLIMPLFKPINYEDYNVTRPGWFLKISNWNPSSILLTSKIHNPTNKSIQETTPEKKSISNKPNIQSTKIDSLHNEIKLIKNEINSLSNYIKSN